MITTEMEFRFLRLCFDSPELWAVGFDPADEVANWAGRQVKKYEAKYNRYPNLKTFYAFISKSCEKQQFTYIKKSLNSKKMDGDFTLAEVGQYIEKQRLQKAIFDAQDLIEEGNVKAAKVSLVEGMSVIYSRPHDYFQDTLKREKVTSVPTGYETFDKYLKGGGPCRGFLVTLMGPRGIGKTLTLLNFGVNAVIEGSNVLHISFQDTKMNLVDRYDKCFGKYKNRKKVKGGLMIQKLVPGDRGNTVADCGSLIAAYQPDLVLVDYLDIINPGRAEKKRFGLTDTAVGLQSLSGMYNCVVMTGKQTGKHTKFSTRDVVSEDASECSAIAQIADISFTLNQTKEEHDSQKIRILLDKNKEGPDGIEAEFKINYKKMSLQEL